MMKNLEAMKDYLREHNLTKQVIEFTQCDVDSENAIEYVFDAHTMTSEEFKAKYFNN